jgi:hypothetical protein
MKPHVRLVIAAIAFSYARKRKILSIYDHGASRHMRVDVSSDGTRVDGFDHTKACHFAGDLPNVFHYGEQGFINFSVDSERVYKGFDYGSGVHFQVSVDGANAALYDHGAQAYFAYST